MELQIDEEWKKVGERRREWKRGQEEERGKGREKEEQIERILHLITR